MNDPVDSTCTCGMHQAVRDAVRRELERLMALQIDQWQAHVVARLQALGAALGRTLSACGKP